MAGAERIRQERLEDKGLRWSCMGRPCWDGQREVQRLRLSRRSAAHPGSKQVSACTKTPTLTTTTKKNPLKMCSSITHNICFYLICFTFPSVTALPNAARWSELPLVLTAHGVRRLLTRQSACSGFKAQTLRQWAAPAQEGALSPCWEGDWAQTNTVKNTA